jgi:imidazoleglycerol phosphate dehydratase HisB
MTLQLRVLRGHDRRHIVVATFKALGLALHRAMAPLE